MKTNSTILFSLLAAGVLSVSACSNATNDKVRDMSDSLTARVDTALNAAKDGAGKMAGSVENALYGNPDSTFIVKASIDNSKELRLLQAGADNGTSVELRAHAKMMITDHQNLGSVVKDYANKKGYTLLDGDHGQADNELATLARKAKGAQWDKEWVNALADGHKDAIDLFEKARDNVKDPELKTIILDALPTLRSHYNMMKQMQDKMGK